MHLPYIRTGISVKAGSCFDFNYCAVCKFPLQTPSIFHPSCKKKQHFPFYCVFGAPRTPFGAVKPPFLRSSIPRPRDVLQFRFRSAVFFLQPPPAGECFQISILLDTFSPRIWARLLLIFTIWYKQPRGNSLSSTDQPQCLLSTPAHCKLPWFPPQTITSSPLLRPATTSVTTIYQPANKVAPCSPSRTIPLPQATLTVLLWDGGTLRVPCPNKSCTVL
ncbi:hypothetical protein TNCV_1574861 [Trichonephila clavipes]|nr:hypothetical protein TNCV_1574861 [Trichonephila clavipes]